MSIFQTASIKIRDLLGMTSLGEKIADNSLSVTLASDDTYAGHFGVASQPAATSDSDTSLMARMRGLVKWAYERMPASLGQKAKTGSLPVTLASDEDLLDLLGLLSQLPASLGQKDKVGSLPVTLASDEDLGYLITQLGCLPESRGQQAKLGALGVTLASDEDLLGLLDLLDQLPASLGAALTANSMPVNIASDQILPVKVTNEMVQEVTSKIGAATVNTEAGAYAAGQLVGDKLQIDLNNPRTAVTLATIQVLDYAKQSSDLIVVLFDSDPTGTTFTDHGAFDVAAADMPKVVGTVKIAAADYSAFNSRSVATKELNMLMQLSGVSNQYLYAAIISGGTPTYGDNGLAITFHSLRVESA